MTECEIAITFSDFREIILAVSDPKKVFFWSLDPLKKSLYPPLFDRLQEKMKSFEGFVDMQVWTWNQRDNHWTLIQVWDSPSTYNHAVQTHGYQSVWRQLLRFTASPTENSPYCLLKSN